jgi:hypothetical protein
MSQQAEQEQALKSDIAQESAENCTEEELSAITGGGKDNQAGQGAATGAVAGAWGGLASGAVIGAMTGPRPLVPKLDVMARCGVAGAAVGTVLGAAAGGSIGATLPARQK